MTEPVVPERELLEKALPAVRVCIAACGLGHVEGKVEYWEALEAKIEASLARPAPLDLDAIEAAFIAYWKDFGTARHNLTAAIREYLRALPAPEPPVECDNCKRIPDGAASSANPRMTICRECWLGSMVLPVAPAPPDPKEPK